MEVYEKIAEEIEDELMKEFLETKKCAIEINLRYSKARIIEAVKKLIDDKHSLLEAESTLTKEDKYSSKKRYDNYDYYLAVYDLRKAGRSWSQVREALRMNEIGSAEIQTARDYYKAAKNSSAKDCPRETTRPINTFLNLS